MSVRVKICGVNDPAGHDAAVTAGADWLGFVFFPRSPRFLPIADAAALAARPIGGAGRVGLFVAPSEAEVAAVLAAVKLDALQVYGPAAQVAALRGRFRMPVWWAVGVLGPGDLPADAAGAERLVIEAKPPAGATRPGGNAATFDWSILHGWNAPAPWTLAGGLRPDNVAEAIRRTGTLAVDVSSGVESAPGRKDAALIHAFIAAVRGTSANQATRAPLCYSVPSGEGGQQSGIGG